MLYSLNGKNKKKVLLVNDTYNWYHWGCTGTSTSLREGIVSRGFDLDTLPISDFNNVKTFPSTLEEFISESFFNKFVSDNAKIWNRLESVDIVFINGEGSIHGLRRIAFILLYIAYLSKVKLNKEVHIVNHSVYPESSGKLKSEKATSLYKFVYSHLDYIAIREVNSLTIMKSLNISATQSFDSLPLYVQKHYKNNKEYNKNKVVFTGSVVMRNHSIDKQISYLKFLKSQGLDVVYLTGAKRFPSKDDKEYIDRLEINFPTLEVIEARSLDEWLDTISSANLLVSGRFHHTIGAICTGTPFVNLNSNTPKSEGIMRMLAQPTPIQYGSEELDKELKIQTLYTLNKKRVTEEFRIKRLNELCKLANKNFDGLVMSK